jgi:glycosyltransferase involved in cell wall biosynthesis
VSEAADARTPDISFIVTTRNSDRTIGACLASLVDQVNVTSEILVIDNSSSDQTASIVREFRVQLENCGPERSAQRNRGLALSRGQVLLFIDSDMVLERTVGAECCQMLLNGFDCLVIPETSFGQGYLARSRAFDRSLHDGNPMVEAARAFRRTVIEELGGFNESLTGPEDWELHDRARAYGYVLGTIQSKIHHDEGKIRARELFVKKRYYSADLAKFLDSNPHRAHALVSRYLNPQLWFKLLQNFPLVPGVLYLKLIEAVAYSTRPRVRA